MRRDIAGISRIRGNASETIAPIKNATQTMRSPLPACI